MTLCKYCFICKVTAPKIVPFLNLRKVDAQLILLSLFKCFCLTEGHLSNMVKWSAHYV